MHYQLSLVSRQFLGDSDYFDASAGYYPFSDWKYGWWYLAKLKLDIVYDDDVDYLRIGDVSIPNAFNMYKSHVYQEGGYPEATEEGTPFDENEQSDLYDDVEVSSESTSPTNPSSLSSESTQSDGLPTSQSSPESSGSSASSVNDGWDPRLIGMENDTTKLFLGRVISAHNTIDEVYLYLDESSCFFNDPYEMIKVLDLSGYIDQIFNKSVLYLPAHPGLWCPHVNSFLGPSGGRLGQFLFPGHTAASGRVTDPYCETYIPQPEIDAIVGGYEAVLPHHPDSGLTLPPVSLSRLARSSLPSNHPESKIASQNLYLTDQLDCLGSIPEIRVRTTNVMLDACGEYETPAMVEEDDTTRLCWWSHSMLPDDYYNWLSGELLGTLPEPNIVTTLPTCWFDDYMCDDPGLRDEYIDEPHRFQTALTPNDEFTIELDLTDQQVYLSGGIPVSDDYQEFHLYYYLADKDDVYPPLDTSLWQRLSINAPTYGQAWMNEYRRQPEDGAAPPVFFHFGGQPTCLTVNFGWKNRWVIDTSSAFCIHLVAFVAVYEWTNDDGYLVDTVDFRPMRTVLVDPTSDIAGWGNAYGTLAFPRQVCAFGPVHSPFIGDKIIPSVRVPNNIA